MAVKADTPTPGQGRELWSSRVAFYFAAVGSAVGFGNVWRFPSLVYEYGGGAFFIPYVLALFLIGIPILVLEIALGQYYQTGDVGVFGSIHSRLRGIGLSSVACGYMVVTYYSMLLAWVLSAFFDSFGSNFWAQDEVTGQEAKAYFFNTIIGAGTLGDDSRPTRLVGRNVGFSFLAWTVVYFCVAFGIKWTGRITYFTMGFPIILLFIFLGRAVTLEGAQDGIQEYIRDANWEVLKTGVWAKATSQIFFSLSITFGIMTAYGSHCKRNEPAFVNSCVVAISNCLFSFIAGFAVYATLGYLAHLEDLENVSSLEYVSFGLVFGSWPVALGTLPGGEHWIRLFFVMLFLLGIDSAFSFLEGFLTVLHDTELLKNVPRKVLCLVMSVCAFLFSLMYATDAGLIFLDTIDYYINFVMLLVGGFECFAAGWVYKIEQQIERLDARIVFSYMFTTFGSVVLACALWFGMKNTDTALWAGFVGLVISYSLGMAFVAFLMSKKKQSNPDLTWKAMCYDLFMGNVMELRSDLREVVGYIPVAWAFLVKHFIPPVIVVLFSLDADTNLNSEGELVYGENGKPLKKMGNYEGYPEQPYQVLGVLIIAFAGFLIVSSLVFPRMYNALRTPGETAAENDKAAVHAAPEEADEEMAKKESVEAQPESPEELVPEEIAQ
jgi:SNF family Na+-dependent transporter